MWRAGVDLGFALLCQISEESLKGIASSGNFILKCQILTILEAVSPQLFTDHFEFSYVEEDLSFTPSCKYL